jgi:hypothetical protein
MSVDSSAFDALRIKAARARTLRVLDLVQTKVQSVRIELVGGEDPMLDRLGTWVFYLPFLVVGYTLVLGAAVTVVHRKLGWGPSLLLFGVAHLGVGAWGVARGRSIGLVSRETVLEPKVAPAPSTEASSTVDSADGDAIPRVRPTVLPLPFRDTPRKNGTHGLPMSESRR